LLLTIISLGLFKNPENPPLSDEFSVCAATLEINPSVTMITDKNGNVSKVIALNDDADVILSKNERYDSLIGVALSDAITQFVDCAAKLGYLNLDSPDAVRISFTGDSESTWLDNSVSELEKYFDDKNISTVVIHDVLDVKAFCQRSGIDGVEDKEALKNWADDISALCVERSAAKLSESEIAALYREECMEKILKQELHDSLDSYVKLILEMHKTNVEILTSALTDYWSIKENGWPVFVPDKNKAAELVSKMDNLILDFENRYGKKISSYDELLQTIADITDLTSQFLAAWENGVESALEMLNESGVAINDTIKKLISNTPTDSENYISAVKDTYSVKYDSMENSNRNLYESERPSVDYSELKNNLINTHGSLNDFFEKNK